MVTILAGVQALLKQDISVTNNTLCRLYSDIQCLNTEIARTSVLSQMGCTDHSSHWPASVAMVIAQINKSIHALAFRVQIILLYEVYTLLDSCRHEQLGRMHGSTHALSSHNKPCTHVYHACLLSARVSALLTCHMLMIACKVGSIFARKLQCIFLLECVTGWIICTLTC